MVFPGPSLRARRIAPATLTPEERPRLSPSSRSKSKAIGEALRIRDEECFVDLQPLEVGGDPALADAFADRAALGLELAGRVVAVERGAGHVGERDDDVAACAREAPSATPASVPPVPTALTKPSILPVGLRPDFRAGRAHVDVAVGDIVELVGEDRAVRMLERQPLGHARCDFHVIVGIAVRHRRNLDERRAERAQCVLLLLRSASRG